MTTDQLPSTGPSPSNSDSHIDPLLRRKVHPKLCVVLNGKEKVNVLRSERSSCVKAVERVAQATPTAKLMAQEERPEIVERGSMDRIPNTIHVSVFVRDHRLDGPAKLQLKDVEKDERSKPSKSVTRGTYHTMELPLSEVEAVLRRPEAAFIELGEPLLSPTPILGGTSSTPTRRAPSRLPPYPVVNGKVQEHPVLVGIIDVQGFDFAHEDFLYSDGTTRFEAIWDQSGESRPSPGPFGYGAEITRAHMNDAIRNVAKSRLPAVQLEPQSQMVPSSHATHVASIAAGNGGVCPHALLAGVLIGVPQAEMDGRLSFYDSTRIAHAVDYLIALAERLREEKELDYLPVSINISLGTNGHAHDGSSGVSRWIDMALSTPGRSVCVAAGNAGQEKGVTADDLGYLMGRIHTAGKIPARGLTSEIEWVVMGDGIHDVSENELEIWYSPADRFWVEVWDPSGRRVEGIDKNQLPVSRVGAGQYLENIKTSSNTVVSVYNELYHPTNGANYIALYLSPFYGDGEVIGVQPGTWRVRLGGEEIRDGNYHGWIERDDLGRDEDAGEGSYYLPSCFSPRSNVDDRSVSSLACGHWVVAVANYDDAIEQVNHTSSQGPTRDGRCKPEIAAPGTKILAANGFVAEDEPWVEMTGTSMASPYVAGVIGLMLSYQPRLTAAQINGIIQRTAQPLPGFSYDWANDAGYGVIDPRRCCEEALAVQLRLDLVERVGIQP